MGRKKKRFPYIKGIIMLLLAGAGGWAIHAMINQGAIDLLSMVGISNFYVQMSLVAIIIFGALILFGLSFKKSVKEILR